MASYNTCTPFWTSPATFYDHFNNFNYFSEKWTHVFSKN